MVANSSWNDDDLLESSSNLIELEVTILCLMAKNDSEEKPNEVCLRTKKKKKMELVP